MVSPVELVRLTQGAIDVEHEDESQAHTATVIEIDPASGEHGVGVVELQLEAEATEGVEETSLAMKEVVGEEMVVHRETEEVHTETDELQIEANGQIHNLQILVVEEEQTQIEDKCK